LNKIIINGRACSGKDVVGDYLVDKYGYKKVTFADGIYKIAYEYFGMTIKDRKLLQTIGQKFREIDPEVWIKAAFNEADKYEKVVISDCRQMNEYLISQEKGYYPIRVHAALATRIKRCIERDGIYPNIEQWVSESETGADGYSYHPVANDGSKEDLYEFIDCMMEGRNA
jgi:cytidylate kinase